MLTQFLVAAGFIVLVPAPKDPPPDDKARGFFGIQLVDNAGVSITRVEPGSPADKAGLRANDFILSIDATRVPNVEEAREVIGRIRPGRIAVVEIRRGDQSVTIKVQVGARPPNSP